jgi:hypothetical protein
MWWVGMQRVQINWDRKKGNDVNKVRREPQFGEFIDQPRDCQLPLSYELQYVCRKPSVLLFTDHVETLQNYILSADLF